MSNFVIHPKVGIGHPIPEPGFLGLARSARPLLHLDPFRSHRSETSAILPFENSPLDPGISLMTGFLMARRLAFASVLFGMCFGALVLSQQESDGPADIK